MRGSQRSGGDGDAGAPGLLAIHPSEAPAGLRLVGDLTSETAHLLAAAFAADGDGRGDLTLDLAGVTFVDSIGLHVIARAAADLTGGRGLVLVAAEPWLRKVLVLAGIEEVPNVRLTERAP